MKNVPDKPNSLFDRVVGILEEARSNVVRTVNSKYGCGVLADGRRLCRN